MEKDHKPLKIKMFWIRGHEEININRPLVLMVLGVRGAGKSSFLEVFADHYLYHGHNVLDLFGARSGEGLAWLRSPYQDEKILLVTGEYIDVICSWNTKRWRDISIHDLESNRIVISASPLYYDMNEEFIAVNHILDLLFKRRGWRKYIYILVRESANLFYSRMKLRQNQLMAKSEATYLIREARHHGLAMGMDTQKFTAVDSDLRIILDYLVIKKQGYLALPRDLWFLYGYLDPHWLRNMKKQEFAVLSSLGYIGIGYNEYPYWHKKPRENLLEKLEIKIIKGEKDIEIDNTYTPI
jgi:hypothetical protein